MVYRKTEKVIAGMEARRAAIIASAIDIIGKSGMEGLIIEAVATRAGVSVGLIYKYFADGVELKAAVTAQLLARDLAAIREATDDSRSARDGLARGIGVLANRMGKKRRLMLAIGATEAYRAGIRAELAKLIKAAGVDGSPAIPCAVIFGAVFEAARSLRPQDEPQLTTALLRALGVSAARRVTA
jgi:AcrR family transcriptional regulator